MFSSALRGLRRLLAKSTVSAGIAGRAQQCPVLSHEGDLLYPTMSPAKGRKAKQRERRSSWDRALHVDVDGGCGRKRLSTCVRVYTCIFEYRDLVSRVLSGVHNAKAGIRSSNSWYALLRIGNRTSAFLHTRSQNGCTRVSFLWISLSRTVSSL